MKRQQGIRIWFGSDEGGFPITDEEIKAGAAAFRRTLSVAGGRTSFDYAVRHHLSWFSAVLERGLGWAGIIRVLSAAGVRRDNGQPLSRGHLSAVYWRQFHAVQSGGREAFTVAPPWPGARANEHRSGPESLPPTKASTVRKRPPARGAAPSSASDEIQQNRAFMKRAVDLRRSDFDDA